VLNDVTFSVAAHEKIGIVGRTGAGKSTVSLSMFHMIDHESGSIEIDGVDVFSIGLNDLRPKIAIIPQDPVLFKGTIRYNLDPHSERSDVEIWEALDRVQLGAFVREQPLRLEALVTENGDNLSVGQRQLLCIARALLRKAKILFLDEATAAVDMETDMLIQKTLREAFTDCTVFTIAHRLNTIIDADKVLVLESGQVVEYDTPAVLLTNPDSAFSKLIARTGTNMSKTLTSLALQKRLTTTSMPLRQPTQEPQTEEQREEALFEAKRAKKRRKRKLKEQKHL